MRNWSKAWVALGAVTVPIVAAALSSLFLDQPGTWGASVLVLLVCMAALSILVLDAGWNAAGVRYRALAGAMVLVGAMTFVATVLGADAVALKQFGEPVEGKVVSMYSKVRAGRGHNVDYYYTFADANGRRLPGKMMLDDKKLKNDDHAIIYVDRGGVLDPVLAEDAENSGITLLIIVIGYPILALLSLATGLATPQVLRPKGFRRSPSSS